MSIGIEHTEIKVPSSVINCDVEGRGSDEGPLFRQYPDGSMSIHLDGYKIMPVEKYRQLIDEWSRPWWKFWK